MVIADMDIRKEVIAFRIKEALAESDTKKIASAMNVSPATVYDWRGGRYLPDVERLGVLASLAGVSPVWLLFGRGGKHASVDQPEGYFIPLTGNVVRSPLAFEEEWYAEIKRQSGMAEDEHLWIMAVTDESMVPTLRKGELALYRTLEWSEGETGDNGLYVLSDSVGRRNEAVGRLIARRVQWSLDGTVTISCDNQSYAAETRKLPALRPIKILGPIVWRGGRI